MCIFEHPCNHCYTKQVWCIICPISVCLCSKMTDPIHSFLSKLSVETGVQCSRKAIGHWMYDKKKLITAIHLGVRQLCFFFIEMTLPAGIRRPHYQRTSQTPCVQTELSMKKGNNLKAKCHLQLMRRSCRSIPLNY